MTKLTITIGAVLVAAGVIAYIATSANSWTALIPSIVGGLMLIAGIVSLRPKAHKHAIHAALLVAMLGAAGSLMNVLKLGELFAGTAERPAAIIVSTLLFVLSVVYLVIGIRSFVRNRLLRKS